MDLIALERQTGAYGTVNAGDKVTVTESYGEGLLAGGCFRKATAAESGHIDPATPEDVVERNNSGVSDEPVAVDGTEREALNTVARKLHEPQPETVIENQEAIEADAAQADKNAVDAAQDAGKQTALTEVVEANQTTEDVKAKEDKAPAQTKQEKVAPVTKEDKAAATPQTK